MKFFRAHPLIATPNASGGLRATGLQQSEGHVVLYQDPNKVLASIDGWARLAHPSGCPALIACAGQSHDGHRTAMILTEYPEPMRYRRAKATAEEHQLERFVADHRRALGSDPFGSFRRGSDPPDFFIRDGSTEYGLDVTQLVLQERVADHDAFLELRTAALLRGLRRFRHLRGHVVYVTLAGDGRWKPVIDDVLDAVETLDPRPRAKEWTPDLAGETRWISSFPNSAGWATTAHLSGAPSSPFYGQMGFELIQTNASRVDADAAWNLLQRLVDDHDKPGTDQLLVVAGAPVGNGFAFPSDLVTAILVLERAQEGAVLRAAHIEKVFLHSWTVRSIDLLEPGAAGSTELAAGDDLFSNQPMFVPEAWAFLGEPADSITVLPDADAPHQFVRMASETEEEIVYTRTAWDEWTREPRTPEADS